MQFYSPWALLLLLILPVLAYAAMRKKRTAAVRFPSLVDLRNCHLSWRLRLRPLLKLARLLTLALLIVALARPRKGTVLSEISTEGVAIEAVVDRSGSMRTEMDFGGKLNRLEVVKKVLADFIQGDDDKLTGRSSDLIGLVTFARYADTVCPLVLSHNVLTEFLKRPRSHGKTRTARRLATPLRWPPRGSKRPKKKSGEETPTLPAPALMDRAMRKDLDSR